MTVVSDTSPPRYLSLIGKLEILPWLFGQVCCPATVRDECLHPRAPQELRFLFTHPPDWLIVVADPPVNTALTGALDPGEAAALSLALAAPSSLLLIDERKGRRVAESLGVRAAGTINIIAEAAVKGLLNYKETITQIRTTTNFRVHDDVVNLAWEEAC
jgi:predicted nucleic acid-binding protein